MNREGRDRIEKIGKTIVHSAITVHKALGPGLLESAYQSCLGFELESSGFEVDYEVKIPVRYRGLSIDNGYRADMLVARGVIVENKVVEHLLPIHAAQILTYLELGGYRLGYLLNWHVTLMKHGIHRYVLRL